MPPTNAIDDGPYWPRTHMKHLRQITLPEFSSRVKKSYLAGLRFGKLGVCSPTTSHNSFRVSPLPIPVAAGPASSLGNHVVHVVRLRADKKMSRVNAFAEIAVVQNEKTSGDISAGRYDYGRSGSRKVSVANPKSPIPVRVQAGRPYPAWAKFWSMRRHWSVLVNLAPKSRDVFWSKVHAGRVMFRRAKDAFRACSGVLALAFPTPALPPLLPSATACLFFFIASNLTQAVAISQSLK